MSSPTHPHNIFVLATILTPPTHEYPITTQTATCTLRKHNRITNFGCFFQKQKHQKKINKKKSLSKQKKVIINIFDNNKKIKPSQQQRIHTTHQNNNGTWVRKATWPQWPHKWEPLPPHLRWAVCLGDDINCILGMGGVFETLWRRLFDVSGVSTNGICRGVDGNCNLHHCVWLVPQAPHTATQQGSAGFDVGDGTSSDVVCSLRYHGHCATIGDGLGGLVGVVTTLVVESLRVGGLWHDFDQCSDKSGLKKNATQATTMTTMAKKNKKQIPYKKIAIRIIII